jgi:hypothetical protein
MSHDRGWRAACGMTISILRFHFEIHDEARGVTAMVVGSGALFGSFFMAQAAAQRRETIRCAALLRGPNT